VFNISVIPNPNNGVFELNIQNNEENTDAKLIIVNMIGQVVYSKNMALEAGESTQAISLENINSGVYFVRIQLREKMIERKIVINRY
jgi:hypothetical protein